MKLFKWERIPDGCMFPTDVFLSIGFYGSKECRRFFVQFQSPEKILETYQDFNSNREVTKWRRKTFRVIVYWFLNKMET